MALSMGAAVETLPETRQVKPAVMPKALVFDTFGTVVDWRGSIIEEGTAWGKSKHFEIDWAGFADRWRAGYAPSMEKVRRGELPWTKLDDLHRMILDELLMEFRMMPALNESEPLASSRVTFFSAMADLSSAMLMSGYSPACSATALKTTARRVRSFFMWWMVLVLVWSASTAVRRQSDIADYGTLGMTRSFATS